MRPSRVYVAGPDVFAENHADLFDAVRATCERLGLVALIPTDCELEVGRDSPPALVAQKIQQANLAMLRSADAVIANLVPFRGTEPDSGTVFEVGFAHAIGLPVIGYGVPARPYSEQIESVFDCMRDQHGKLRERTSGTAVEDFGLPLNLMLACCVSMTPDVTAALEAVSALGADARLKAF